jgi:hypothetical protein
MTALTPELEGRIIESVRNGTPPRQAALSAGISDDTLQAWIRISKGERYWPRTQVEVSDETRASVTAFAERLAHAQAECFGTLTSALYHNATTIDPRTGRSDTQAADKLLSKHSTFRQDWFEKQHLQVDSVVTHRREDALVKAASIDQLEAWASLPELPAGPTDS